MPSSKKQEPKAKSQISDKKQRKGDTSRTSSQGRKESSGGIKNETDNKSKL